MSEFSCYNNIYYWTIIGLSQINVKLCSSNQRYPNWTRKQIKFIDLLVQTNIYQNNKICVN